MRISAAAMRGLLSALIAVVALAGCGGGEPRAEETDQLDEITLSPDERAVAEALINGFKSETGNDAVSEAEVARAACYAKSVNMPAPFSDVHLLYLADYAAIDADFYAWFDDKGVSAADAWDIAERVKNGFDACAVGGV